jgi:hypothetical protein
MDNLATLEKQAIDAAISSNWKEAISFNEEILIHDKKNVDAYLRLGFACLQNNQLNKAKKYYLKALNLQPGNYLINENLERIKILESKKMDRAKTPNLDPYLFLEIPGKTKTIDLVKCGQKNILVRLATGQKVEITPKKRRIEIRTTEKEYLGCLPDDLSKRLMIFIKAGSIFSAYIKECGLKTIAVFLKEEKKGIKVAKYASFPVNIQSNLDNLTQGHGEMREELKEEDLAEITDNDLEKLAESLNEEKEYLGFDTENKEETEEE